VDLLDNGVEPFPGIQDPVPVGSSIRVLSMGVFGKDNDGEQPLAPHYRTDAGTPGLLGSPDTLAAVLCRFRNVEVVAVDAAVIGVDRSDAGGHEGDVPFFVAFGGKAP